MIPGVLAGLYDLADCHLDVAALAARAGAAFLADRALQLHPDRREVVLERSGALPYDLLSLDVGSRPLGVERVRDLAHVVPVRPLEECVARLDGFVARAQAGECAPHAVVVGGGAGGVEIAIALRRRLGDLAGARVTLVEQTPKILAGHGDRVRALATRAARAADVELRPDVGSVAPEEDGVALGDGARIDAAIVVWATGAEGHDLARSSGLALDDRGFVLVDATLRSVSRREVFATGDCARMQDHPDMPRAGVFAVRQGPILTRNLRAALAGRGLTEYRPQSGFLALLSTGDRRAIASYRGRGAHGRVWWWLKDRIDRRFVARYAPPRADRVRGPDESAMGGGEMAPCGGCAAKLESGALAALLAQVATAPSPDVPIGLAARDDAAVLSHPAQHDVVATIDAFPPFFDDLHAVGDIAAVNAASDVYAMGGQPTAALLLVGAGNPPGAARDTELALLQRGAAAGLARLDVPLVGGHTLDVGTALVGFAVVGRVPRGEAWTKGGACSGDRLVLTKPLGTGVVLAASRAGECAAAWTEAAVAAMRASNGAAIASLRAAGVRGCTDVTGFGLVGHLREMLRASRLAGRIELGDVPSLPGALELLARGWRSSADAANRGFLDGAEIAVEARDETRLALLCDPQTSGGLLAAVPAPACAGLLEALAVAGVAAAAIGELVAGPPDRLVVA
jgi:selenide,water dikinase